MRPIDADALIARYDRIHVGEPGKARKLIEEAPTIDAVPLDKIQFTDLYLDGREAIAVFKFGNQGITLRKKCDELAPVVHGQWVHTDMAAWWFGKDECSECQYHDDERNDLSRLKYCPNCGAKMDGGNDEAD